MEQLKVAEPPLDTVTTWSWGTKMKSDMAPERKDTKGLSEEWDGGHWVKGTVWECQAGQLGVLLLLKSFLVEVLGSALPAQKRVRQTKELVLCMAPLRDTSASQLALCLVPPLSQPFSMTHFCLRKPVPVSSCSVPQAVLLPITGGLQSLLPANGMTIPPSSLIMCSG